MNIVTRLAIIEQLLEEATLESSHELDTRSVRQSDASGQQLVDELDQAQMLKAASHLRPSRHAST